MADVGFEQRQGLVEAGVAVTGHIVDGVVHAGELPVEHIEAVAADDEVGGLVVAMAGHRGDIRVGVAHTFQLVAQQVVLAWVGEAHLAAIALIVGQATEGVVVAEAHIAAVYLLQGLDREGVVAHNVGVGQDGALHIFSQLLAGYDLDIRGGVAQLQTIHLLDVVPFLNAVDKLLGELAGHTVGVFLAAGLHDVSVITHATFEAAHNGGIVGMH